MQTQMTQINEAILSTTGANAALVNSTSSMWELDQGCTAKVIGFVGISAAYLKRMREIGLDIGAEISCLNRPPFSAPRQFQICDGVFSLDKDIAASIQVSSI
ncbi:MAG: Fe2+ transport system protein FeoA [Arenicella sp.]|jgi:Fe2+ transport system protein FeoA